jgi:capsular exopolysaccharide synthesis family protein
MAETAVIPAAPYASGKSYQLPGMEFDIAALLRQAWSAVYRNLRLILVIFALCIAASIALTMLATRQYEATATLKIDMESAKILGTEDANASAAVADAERFLQTQVEIVQSRSIARDVDRALGLSRNDAFITAMGAKPVPVAGDPAAEARRRGDQVLGLLQTNLDVSLPRTSRVLSVSFTSPDPALSQRIANAFSAAVIASNLKRKFDETAYARGFLEQQLIGAKQRLEDSERAMIQYAREAGLIDTSSGVGASSDMQSPGVARSLVTADLVALNAAHVSAQAVRVAAEQRWRQAQATPLLSLPEVVSNPAITQLSQSRAQIQAAYSQERQRHRAEFPLVQQIGAQLVAIDREITQLALAIRQSIGDQYRTAARQEAALSGEVEQLKRSTLSEQDRSVRYNILKRETDTNRTMYDGLLQRYKVLSAQAGATANNISLVDTANLPTRPVSPRPFLNIALGLILGCLISAIVILVKEQFDDTVRSPEDVPQKLGLVLLNTIPLVPTKETVAADLSKPQSAIAESYAALRISIELVDSRGAPSSLLFTSSRPGEGKSTSAYAVARDFARSGKRTLILDADLRRPSLHKIFGVSNTQGLSSVLAQQTSLEAVIQKTDIKDLDFIPAGKFPPNPTELLSGDSFKVLLDRAKKEYDLVIVDSPPVLGLADAIILSGMVKSVVFIAEANNAHHGNTKSAIRRLAMTRANILGAVLTKYNASKVGYSYYSYMYQNYHYKPENN